MMPRLPRKLPKMLWLLHRKISRESLMKEIALRKKSRKRRSKRSGLLKTERRPKQPNRQPLSPLNNGNSKLRKPKKLLRRPQKRLRMN